MIENRSGLKVMGFSALLLLLFADTAVSQVPPGGSPGEIIDLQGGSSVGNISLNVLSDSENWTLGIGQNEKTISLEVDASGSWQVEASDASSLGGRMTKYGLSEGYDPSVQLADSLKLFSPYQPSSTPVDLAEGGVIAAGPATGTSPLNVPVFIDQQIAWSDQPLDQNHKYRTLIAFTGSLAS
jgi:hypothetical protein